jgi:hypothetical protein
MCWVGQNQKVYIWYFKQAFRQIYSFIRRTYTVLANPKHVYVIAGLFDLWLLAQISQQPCSLA